MSEFDDRLDELLDRTRDGALSGKEVQELEQLLWSDPALRRRYLERMWLEEKLSGVFQEQANMELPFEELSQGNGSPKLFRWGMLVALAASVVLLLSLVLFTANQSNGPAISHTVAALESSSGDIWSLPPLRDAKGRLAPGTLRLESGMANIRFDSDALLSLEGPAELIIENAMRARLVSGKVLVQAPEAAHGFVLSLPEGEAVDLGTLFSAYIGKDGSLCEVLEGDIIVRHSNARENHHLKSGEAMLLTALGLVSLDYMPSKILAPMRRGSELHKAAMIATVISGGGNEDPVGDRMMLVKIEPDSYMQRRALFSMDLGAAVGRPLDSASLNLNLVPSGIGFAAYLPDEVSFAVYGIVDESQEDFSTVNPKWQEVPGYVEGHEDRVNEAETMLVGRIQIPSGLQRGNFQISGAPLHEFISKDTNGRLSFLVVRETYGTQETSLVHAFAGINHPEASSPSLELFYSEL